MCSCSRGNMTVRVVEYATKDLRLSSCMSVFASRELRGTTHRFRSVSTTLNGGLDAFRLSVWPISPWVAVGVGRGGAECEDACRGCSVHVLAFAGAV